MMTTFNSKLKKVILIALLVLPFLIYFIFVYASQENFFTTLGYAGPEKVAENPENPGKADTIPYAVPPFEFTTQQDTLLSSKELKGNIYIANFFFTSCPTICPAMNYQVKQLQERFKGYENFKIVSFSVDPRHDSVPVLRDYAEKMSARPGIWYFMTGPKDSIYSTARDFFASASKDSAAPGGFLHSSNLVLVDWKGRIRSRKDEFGNIKAAYPGTKTNEVNKLEDDIKVLIAEYEKLKSEEEYESSQIKQTQSSE